MMGEWKTTMSDSVVLIIMLRVLIKRLRWRGVHDILSNDTIEFQVISFAVAEQHAIFL